MKPLVYLSVPYTHVDKNVVLNRFEMVNRIAAHLMKRGETVFSPISQNHPIATQCGLPVEWEYWEKFDRDFLSCCHKLYVLMLDGWRESKGVQAEIKIASELCMDIEYLEVVEFP